MKYSNLFCPGQQGLRDVRRDAPRASVDSFAEMTANAVHPRKDSFAVWLFSTSNWSKIVVGGGSWDQGGVV
jgi:hypothetical protein